MSAIKRKNSLSSADRGGIQNRPQIAVAVASWNDRAGLAACLDSILAEPENQGVEIVVARSATSDIALLEEDYPSVRFVRAEDHANPSDLRCAAMREASGDVVLFTDDAQPPRSDWIATVAARHQEASRKIASGTESDDHERWAEHFVSGDDESDSAGPRPRQVAQLVSGDRAVMIGAGPGGLTAGYLLAKGGVDVTVLEAEDVIGGISQTAKYKGYRFDIGGHRFFTKYPPVQELWEEILGEDFISVPRLSRIYYEGRFFDYPLKAMNALRGLGVLNACLIFLSYLKSHLWPSPVEETFEQWVSNRFGKRLYGIFFKTYTEKVWGIPCSEIRAEWAAQRIQ